MHDDGKGGNNQSKRTQQSGDVRCWICLDEGPDESGNGLVRDCSCRGHSGYAHVSCLVQYGEKTTTHRIKDNEIHGISTLWTNCPNCLTRYNNDVAMELANQYVSFVERQCKEGWGGAALGRGWQLMLHLEALNQKLFTLQVSDGRNTREEEIVQVVENVLSIIRDVKSTDESLREQFRYDEAYALSVLGRIHGQKGTAESFAEALTCYRKSRELYASMERTEGVLLDIECNMARAKFWREKFSPARGNYAEAKNEYAETATQLYEFVCEEYGQDAYQTIRAGVACADALDVTHRGIEAERLYQKLLIISRQTHGPGNQTTESIEVDYNAAKKRSVLIKAKEGKGFVMTEEGTHFCEAVMYEKGSDSYIVLQYKAFSVSSSKVVVPNGTPVICHSMTGQEKHLNGKIGDVRSWNMETECYEVHFEDKSIAEPHMVPCKDIRIVFDLPDIDE